MAAGARTSSARLEHILSKLEKSVSDGNYYEAQQMYKTLYSRYSSQKNYEEATKLLLSGVSNMLKHQQLTCASELCLLIVEVLKTRSASPTQEHLDTFRKIYEQWPKGADVGKIQFLKAAVKWFEAAKDSQASILHDLMARDLTIGEDYPAAIKHFVRGNSPSEFSAMLMTWWKEGKLEERDLFLARAVLQSLCMKNLNLANGVFEECVAKGRGLTQTPLVNYLRFLLMVLERDAYPLFDMLRKKYAASLARDPAFSSYLDHIAALFYNVKPQSAGLGGFMGEMLKNLLGSK